MASSSLPTTCYVAVVTLSVLFGFMLSTNAQSACPRAYGCQCGNNLLRDKPGIAVVCSQGGLPDIPVNDMPGITRYLYISAPPANPNHFRIVPGMFSKFNMLEEIQLTGSDQLQSIGEDAFFELSATLRVLNLTNNAIEYLLENDFRNLENLQQLYLDNNLVTGLNSGTFVKLKRLELLSLRSNKIRDLPEAFSTGLSQLNKLDLSNNPLGTSNNLMYRGTVLASAFNITRNLQTLLLHNTNLSTLPFAELGRDLPNLEQLDVGGSPFCSIADGQFSRLRKLKYLNLCGLAQSCGGQFQLGPKAFAVLNSLERLDLCKICMHKKFVASKIQVYNSQCFCSHSLSQATMN